LEEVRMTAVAVLYDPAVEVPERDEPEIIAGILDTLAKNRAMMLRHTGRALRSAHAQCLGLLRGELTVLDDLPVQLAQGLFARPRRYPVVIRLSAMPSDGGVATAYGLAIKVIGVEGERVAGSENDVTQDFVLVNKPVFKAANATEYLRNLKLLEPATEKAIPVEKPAPVPGEIFYSQVPLRYGRYIAKINAVPVDPQPAQGCSWEMRVQLCTDLKTMPIEDATVAWPEAASPYVAVARICVGPGAPCNDAKTEAGLSFSPWHALAAHQPLGSINRARKMAYAPSAAFRGAPHRMPMTEPKRIEDVPE
jgi:hypothetical protein